MKSAAQLLKFSVILLFLCGCRSGTQQPQQFTSRANIVPLSTIKDLMVSIVDPNADSLWSSVRVTVTAKGTETKMPRTDEDWADVRQHAITLLEATNLLLIPNRHAAKPGENAENGIEETPEAIEALINQDRATFENRVQRLRTAATTVLAAIDKKDVAALEESSLGLDSACEACHVVYWYPKDSLSKRLFDEAENHDNKKDKH